MGFKIVMVVKSTQKRCNEKDNTDKLFDEPRFFHGQIIAHTYRIIDFQRNTIASEQLPP